MGWSGREGRGGTLRVGKMEGKKALAFNVLLLVLLGSMLAASARDPSVGMPLEGKGIRKRELDCCNDCRCNKDMTSCTCKDGVTGGCSGGCQDCHRDHGHYYCRDILDVCPETCDYDYDDDDAPQAYFSR